MSSTTRAVMLFFSCTVLMLGCLRSQTSFGHYDEENNFTVLPVGKESISLPMIVGPSGVEPIECFKKTQPKAVPVSVQLGELITQSEREISVALGDWLAKKFNLSLKPKERRTWSVEVKSPVVAQLSPQELLLRNDQRCIDKNEKWLPSSQRAVDTLVGASSFLFSTKIPLNAALQAELAAGVKKSGFTFIQRDLLFDPDHPGKAPGLLSWSIETPTPVYFAFRFLSSDKWQTENDPSKCNTYLVWNDANAQQAQCDDFKVARFAIGDQADLNPKVNKDEFDLFFFIGGVERSETVSFHKTTQIAVDNRLMLWVTPQREEEGATLQIDSLFLAPGEPFTIRAGKVRVRPKKKVPETKSPAKEPEKQAKKKAPAAKQKANPNRKKATWSKKPPKEDSDEVIPAPLSY